MFGHRQSCYVNWPQSSDSGAIHLIIIVLESGVRMDVLAFRRSFAVCNARISMSRPIKTSNANTDRMRFSNFDFGFIFFRSTNAHINLIELHYWCSVFANGCLSNVAGVKINCDVRTLYADACAPTVKYTQKKNKQNTTKLSKTIATSDASRTIHSNRRGAKWVRTTSYRFNRKCHNV